MAATEIRHPVAGDTRGVIDLVYRSPNLDNNSPYFYGMWVKEWWRSSAVALEEGRVVGVLLGFVRPTAPDVYFAWQTCIDPASRSSELATRLYDFVLEELCRDGVTRLEMTVNSDNRLVRLLLAKLARRYGSPVQNAILFEGEDLADGHYTEELRAIDLRAWATPAQLVRP